MAGEKIIRPRTKSLVHRPGEPSCPACGIGLAIEEIQTDDFAPCTRCRAEFVFHAYPALIRPKTQVRTGEMISEESDASCFYHPQKKAEVACDRCGKFMCALCEIEMDGQHICPACFNTGVAAAKSPKMERRRVLYDSMALMVALLPVVTIIFWFVTCITAPIALFLAIRHWNTPSSLLGRTKIRLIFAMIIALLQIATWAFFIIQAFNL